MDEALEYSENSQNLERMMKSGEAFRFFSPFEKSKAYESDESGEKKKYIEFIGSSDSEDLVGDVMELSALKEMEASAPGTIMLRDHHRSTDKVFGWITEAKLQQENGKYLIIFKAEVDEEDPANIRIWRNIQKGRKLGASVTVRVLEKKDNPRISGAMLIKSVLLLEISIVTIPCNQDAWTLAATASKALQISVELRRKARTGDTPNIPAIFENAGINSKEKEESMSQENNPAGTAEETAVEETAPEAAEIVEETPVEVETESKSVMPRTLAAKAAFEERKRAAEETKAAPTVPEVTTKGLFAEEQAKRQPTLWDLFDILYSVKWQLMDRKWAMEWVDGVEDNYDYVGEYNVACLEFADAAVKSFVYYGGFQTDAVTALDDDDVIDDVIENALDVKKAFEVFAELFVKSPADNRPTLQSIGDEIIALAAEKGIPLPVPAEAPEPAEDVIRKSQIFLDAETRAAAAEERVKGLTTELEVATACLETAVEVVEKINQQPLRIGQS